MVTFWAFASFLFSLMYCTGSENGLAFPQMNLLNRLHLRPRLSCSMSDVDVVSQVTQSIRKLEDGTDL